MPKEHVIIVGSGIAALVTAWHLHEYRNVIIFTKSKKEESNSWLAQGGVAAAFSKQDDWRFHYEDTMIAGGYHNDERAVETLVKEGPKRIRELIAAGLQFDTDKDGRFHLGNEGAHRHRRILHAGGDQTGRALVSFLLEQLRGNVTIIEDECVIELLVHNGRCIGVKTKNHSGIIAAHYASAVVLSTGGCTGMYEFSSNASTVTGDGIALAYRAGAVITDMEFIQFHPTMLCVDGKAVGLISEAVRGEGAVLVTEDGTRLMEHVHPQQDLAPRDIVARTIHGEIIKGNRVYLDISKIANFSERFPAITKLCKSYGINIETGKLPVVPGAHFLMGGIQVDSRGQTSIPGLYAVGEAACTGVHGANRLASNSLLEGIVFGARVAETLRRHEQNTITYEHLENRFVKKSRKLLPTKQQIQTIMMHYVGIVRDEQRLTYAKQWFEQFSIPDFVNTNVDDFKLEEITIIHMLITGWLITTSALQRTESRGGHYRHDYPHADENWQQRRILRVKQELMAKVWGEK
ncbi:L-aspartate oxidase [Thermaerobacillus caldiproteolyticus]|uniref:L-aspartate oxidase n=1 Tax=Thermaerobacillus caldiproteolyticus TaxID=247480 RepID=A0A7W0BZ11_9BACL|nr:L-aspartate oxidase [Anoxybacillus caldiproteolyticus]MBA2873639.1 L-aspartate oxidase [Anoxybacillus caldiproteolyticus]